MTKDEKVKRLMEVKHKLLEAYRDAERGATIIEEALDDEAALAEDETYGWLCRLIGATEDMIIMINNQINKLKKQ